MIRDYGVDEERVRPRMVRVVGSSGEKLAGNRPGRIGGRGTLKVDGGWEVPTMTAFKTLVVNKFSAKFLSHKPQLHLPAFNFT